jgi:hypothetical protein
VSKPFAVGAYAYQRLNLATKGKAPGRDTKASNRTWEIRPSGIIGGLGKRGHGGIANPPRNRKGESGSPPPKAYASEFYPNHRLRWNGFECKRLLVNNASFTILRIHREAAIGTGRSC